MSYSEESERNSYNSWENKNLGETYREAESRIEKSDAFQRNLEQQMDRNYQSERNRHNRSSGSYSGGSYSNEQDITSLAKWIGHLGILILVVSGIILYYEIQLPAILGVSFLQVSFQASITLIITGYFPKLVVGFLMLSAVIVLFFKSRTPTGFQINAVSFQDWIGIISLFIAAYIAKRLLIKN
jgi:hypothetical protein